MKLERWATDATASQITMEYVSAEQSSHLRRWLPSIVLLSGLLLANAGALAVAWTDRSWGALAIAIYLGPIMNGIVAAISIASLLVLRRRSGFPLRAHLALSIAGPAGWIVVDAAIIFNMGLHGC